ncbi:MAG: hypothetical protein OHK0029_05130 [Armatimonadaceae bacterium]
MQKRLMMAVVAMGTVLILNSGAWAAGAPMTGQPNSIIAILIGLVQKIFG